MSIHIINEFLNRSELTEDDIHNIKYHAEQGNSEAQYHLALIYDLGNGLPRNPREAERWYKLSASAGNMNAQYYLARLYDTQNSGIRRDLKEAIKWYKAAAEQGHPDAIKAIAS